VIAGRYVIGKSFASGGVGTVHLGRLCGAGGFSRVVAIKRLFPIHAGDAEFREMLLREGRLASRIRHPNVVPTIDVVQTEKDVYIVMEYVHGVSLSRVLKNRRAPMPVSIALGIIECVLAGLHAAHEARGEDGTALGIVHRDVSPQNVLIGADGITRLIDFGIAKAATHHAVTEPGIIKGKAAYMAPEQLRSETVSRQSDVFATAAVLWEMLAGRALIDEHPGNRLLARMTQGEKVAPSRHRADVDARLDRVVMRGLELKPAERFGTADAMVTALRDVGTPAHANEIAKWLEEEAGDEIELSEERVRLMERASADHAPSSSSPMVVPRAASEARPSLARTPPDLVKTRPTRVRARWTRQIARFGAALAVGALALLALRTNLHRAPAPPLARAVAMAPAPPIAVPAVTTEAPVTELDVTPVAVQPTLTTSSPAPAPERVSRPKSSPRASRPAGKTRCDPPYTLDASGRKHYDPSCF